MRKKFLKAFSLALLMLIPNLFYAHGLSSASAKIELRPANLIEIQVQFNFIDLLNHKSHDYALPIIASLPKEKFELLYNEVIKLFKKNLLVKLKGKSIKLNRRFPSKEQVFNLLQQEFIGSKVMRNIKPYTFSDRRFYQQFYFDFRLKSKKDLEQLKIQFPKELRGLYVTYTESKNQALNQGGTWQYKP